MNNPLTNLLAVAVGGAVGAVLRYSSVLAVHHWFGKAFPYGTLAVNLLGSLALGVLAGLTHVGLMSHHGRLLLMTGLLGAFTTFSTFSLDTFRLVEERHYLLAAGNMAGSCAAGLTLAAGGYALGRLIGHAVSPSIGP